MYCNLIYWIVLLWNDKIFMDNYIFVCEFEGDELVCGVFGGIVVYFDGI